MPTLDELGSLLLSEGAVSALGGVAVNSLHYNAFPASNTVDATVIREYAGSEPEYVLGEASVKLVKPRVQVQVRAVRSADARQRIMVVFDVLTRVVNQTLSGTFYVKIRPIQSPFWMQRDENDKHIWVFNVECEKRPS
jgi:hypothetical protein